MKRRLIPLWALIAYMGVGAMCVAYAQPSPSAPPVGPVVRHSPDGADYLSGGAGSEDRSAMAARQSELPVKIVFSVPGGEYAVAKTLIVKSEQGQSFAIDEAGPVVMMKLAPGQYSLEATRRGKVQTRSIHATSQPQTINWQFAE
jgi:hypothetical protein